MPKALSTKPEPYQHTWTPLAKYDEIYTGWAYPPKDYAKWGELVYEWAKHCVEKYGRAEVEQWYWEIWNEPNIGYWRGTPEEFRKLHDYAIDARAPRAADGAGRRTGHRRQRRPVHARLPRAPAARHQLRDRQDRHADRLRVVPRQGPARVSSTATCEWASPTSWPTIDGGFRIVASFPELKAKPIVIGESDPDGCAACQGPQLGYRNRTMYSSYTAAAFARKHDLAERHGVNLEGALTWAFEFEDQPYFAGFRVLATNGIDLPVLNVFRMFSQMGGQRVAATSDGAVDLDAMMKTACRDKPDVAALASRDANRVTILAWHYHDDDVAGPDAAVTLSLEGLGLKQGKARLQHFRIDAAHSNAFTAWQRLGSPAAPHRRNTNSSRRRASWRRSPVRRRAWTSPAAGRRCRSRCRARPSP